jgi:hypothetical protein
VTQISYTKMAVLYCETCVAKHGYNLLCGHQETVPCVQLVSEIRGRSLGGNGIGGSIKLTHVIAHARGLH